MKKKILPKHIHSTPGYINEEQQLKRLKNNMLLVIAILGLSVFIRYNENESGVTDNSKQYIDVPSQIIARNLQSMKIV